MTYVSCFISYYDINDKKYMGILTFYSDKKLEFPYIFRYTYSFILLDIEAMQN